MLTPSYLLHAVEPAEEIAEQLHQDILNRIIERVLHRFKRGDDYILTATDKWNIELLQEAGYLLEDIQKDIADATRYMQSEIAEAMEDAGVRALEYDDKIYRQAGLDPVPLVQSTKLIGIMQRDYEATMGEWVNFTRTTATATQQAFIRACDKAYHQAMTGAISMAQAVKEALEEVVNAGVYVRYPSGHTDTIETATTRAVRTGISQASADIQNARMDEFDIDLVLVSSHMGARPEHAEWQGKIYSRSGTSDKYPDFVSSTGYGSVTGLCGANCRHNFGPYFEGMDNPFDDYDSEENLRAYELQQRQRALERRIRDTKRKTMNWKTAMDAETDPVQKSIFEAEYQRKAALLQKQNAAYKQFCVENDFKTRADRVSIAKWDREQAAQARAAAKKKPQISAKKPKDYSVFSTLNITKADSIRPKSIINNLKKSEIGQRTIDYLEKEGVPVNLCYGIDNPEGYSGTYDPFDDVINVYCDITKTTMETAKTVIHEATHRQMGSTHTFAEELECFKAEVIHEKGVLTKEDLESIIKHIQKHYPDLR